MKTFPPTDEEAYKALARNWAATVTVVTAKRPSRLIAPDAPALDGFTATAFLTVSIERLALFPPSPGRWLRPEITCLSWGTSSPSTRGPLRTRWSTAIAPTDASLLSRPNSSACRGSSRLAAA